MVKLRNHLLQPIQQKYFALCSIFNVEFSLCQTCANRMFINLQCLLLIVLRTFVYCFLLTVSV